MSNDRLPRKWAKLERFGLLIVFLLLMMDIPQKILSPAINFLTDELGKTSTIEQKATPAKKPTLSPDDYKEKYRHSDLEMT